MIHFICALRCEALPIIEYYDLKYLSDAQLFGVYANDNRNISLTVTGVGKLAATAGTVYSYTKLNCDPGDVWLNVGIAGHRDHTIGDIYLSNCIEDSACAELWYPQVVIDIEIPTEKLLTLDRPSTNYDEVMFDMEGSGFISAACRFGSMELIHSIKIISDNQDNPAGKLNEDKVNKLIELNTEKVVSLASQLETLSNELISDIDFSDDFELFLEQWHFTQYQRVQLKKLLHRWHLLSPDASPLESINKSCNDACTALDFLLMKMNQAPFYLVNEKSNV